MANEIRVYDNLVGGLVEDNPLTAAATTLNSAGLASLRAIDTTNHAVIVIDPDGESGAPFAKRVTAHTAGVGAATIEAAALWGTARDVPRDTPWVHAYTAEDASLRVVRIKTADETLASNTTLQDDDHLSFAIGANEWWVVTYYLFVTCGSGTPDVKFAPSVPSGATVRQWGVMGPALGTTTAEGSLRNQALGSATALSVGIPPSATLDVWAIASLVVENGSTPGNVVLQWAQNTSDASGIFVERGSYLTADRILR